MPIKYVDQSVNELNYIFINKNIRIEDYFKIIRQKEHFCHEGKLTVSIVGESHVIEFQSSKTQFTEILASINDTRLTGISLRQIPISSLEDGLGQEYGYKKQNFRYSFSIRKEKCNRATVLKELTKLKKSLTSDDLLFEWGGGEPQESAITIPSFTFIKHKFYNSGFVSMYTLHFYKNEEILVSSRSILKNSRSGA